MIGCAQAPAPPSRTRIPSMEKNLPLAWPRLPVSGSKTQSVRAPNGTCSTENCPVSYRSAHQPWKSAVDTSAPLGVHSRKLSSSCRNASRFIVVLPPGAGTPAVGGSQLGQHPVHLVDDPFQLRVGEVGVHRQREDLVGDLFGHGQRALLIAELGE